MEPVTTATTTELIMKYGVPTAVSIAKGIGDWLMGSDQSKTAKENLLLQLQAAEKAQDVALTQTQANAQYQQDYGEAKRRRRTASIISGIQAASLGSMMMKRGVPSDWTAPQLPSVPAAAQIKGEAAALPTTGTPTKSDPVGRGARQ